MGGFRRNLLATVELASHDGFSFNGFLLWRQSKNVAANIADTLSFLFS